MDIRSFLIDRLLLPSAFSNQWKKKQHDFITPQAYGRNTFSDRELRIIRVKRDEHANDTAMFRWLASRRFDPGKPNEVIASHCTNLTKLSGKPVIGQWEVMFALWRKNSEWYEIHSESLFAIWPSQEGSQKTKGLLEEVKNTAKDIGLSHPLLVAHPEHVQRCYFIARKTFGVSPAVFVYPEEENAWFDEDSVQWWTRSRRKWLFYELCLARPHHLLHGWM